MYYHNFINYPSGMPFIGATFVGMIVIFALWELVWKGLAMWKAARLNQPWWFVALFVFNTFGILPILYLYVFSPKDSNKPEEPNKP